MAKTKGQPMTEREKRLRAEARKELRAEGILPQPKARRNYKKFCAEAEEEFGQLTSGDGQATLLALGIMLGFTSCKPTLEAIGVSKVVKSATEIKRYIQEIEAQGGTQLTTREIYERIKHILTA